MNLVRQSLRTRPPFGELNDPPLPADSNVLFEEEYCRIPITKSRKKRRKQDESFKPKDDKRILKTSSKKELSHADFVERLIIETSSSDKQRRRQSSILNGENSYHINKLLKDENNDWFFEKILEKFENIRAKKANRHERSPPRTLDNDVIYGVERIVERRYYVKKPPLISKRDQLTSTSDLTVFAKKTRQISGVSSSLTATSTCSRCSSSTPTFIGDLRDQSHSLRHEISELKSEVEQLQISQKEFFQQVQTQFQSKTGSTTTISQNFDRPVISTLRSTADKNETFSNKPIPLTTGKRLSLTSTESLTSESSETSTPKPAVPLRSGPTRPVSEFIATKNPSIAPAPPVNTSPGSKPPSSAPTPLFNTYISSKPASIPATSPITELVAAKNPSIAPTITESVTSRASSTVSTPSRVLSPMESSLTPVYESEMAHRRVLSPRSQIVASSASVFESSDSSSESFFSEKFQRNSRKTSKASVSTLRDNDLKDLVQYSSHLELSGFPARTTPIIANPNTSSTFWDSVDEYLENTRSTDTILELPTMPRVYRGNRYGLNNDRTKQLEKYDLEINPQEIITSSAPLLMPPLDISP